MDILFELVGSGYNYSNDLYAKAIEALREFNPNGYLLKSFDSENPSAVQKMRLVQSLCIFHKTTVMEIEKKRKDLQKSSLTVTKMEEMQIQEKEKHFKTHKVKK